MGMTSVTAKSRFGADVSDLSRQPGHHSDPLAGLLTPFRYGAEPCELNPPINFPVSIIAPFPAFAILICKNFLLAKSAPPVWRRPLALPLGELSPQATERVLRAWTLFTLSVLAALGHLSQRERQGVFRYQSVHSISCVL